MIWLLLSILCSTVIFVIFKLFDRYKVNNLQAIVINYFAAFAVGFGSVKGHYSAVEIIEKEWFISILILGLMFILLFQVMALVSQKLGVAAASVAVKMSLVIPVIFGFYYYGDSIHFIKLVGIILALASVYLATRKPSKIRTSKAYLWLPIALFVGSGLLDTLIKYNQHELVPEAEHAHFTSSIFGMAALFGIVFISINAIKKPFKFHWKNLLGGIALGIPNYGSIYFLLKALEHNGLESSVIFPVNNVGIVALSALTGWFLFSEKLSRQNQTGILMAIVSIVLITSGNTF